MTVRPYEEADRSKVLQLLHDPRSIDSPGRRLYVGRTDTTDGVAVWDALEAGALPTLTAVATSRLDWRLLYRLVVAAAQDAIDQGFERGRFTVKDRRFLARLRRDFTIDAQPSGWEPNTGRPIQWDIEVDLRDALRQLRRVT